MNPAAPEGTPLRRISAYKHIYKHRTAPPCLGEALRRGALIELYGLMIFMVRVRTPFIPFQQSRRRDYLSCETMQNKPSGTGRYDLKGGNYQ